MYGIYDNITEKALSLGACGLLQRDMPPQSLFSMLHTPQGREFCVKTDFPKVPDIAPISLSILQQNGVYADFRGEIRGIHDIYFIGKDTDATIQCNGTEALYHIVALDGAHVCIQASGHAVVSVDNSESARIKIINNDNTAKVRCHRQEC